MKLHTTNNANLNLFTAYGSDYVAVNQEKHSKNLIVLPESMLPDWTSSSVATLTEADMEILTGLGTEIILLGTGQQLRFPPPELMQPFMQIRKGLEVMDLSAACRTYNILLDEGRKVAAALLFD